MLLRRNACMTAPPELSALPGISQRNVEKHLAALKEQGRIIQRGALRIK